MTVQWSGEDDPSSTITRIPAFLLIAGGLIGIGVCLWFGLPQAFDRPTAGAIVLIFLFLYVMAVWKGIDLWRGRREGYRWGLWLFALQIPIVSMPAVTYKFTAGLSAGLALIFHPDRLQLKIPFYLGSSFKLNLGGGQPPALIGFNAVAVMALLLLVESRKPRRARSSNTP